MGSFASSYLAPLGEYVANGNYYGRTFFAATVGGTASSIGGGKFANGAVSSAMVYLFNDVADTLKKLTFAKAREHYIKNTGKQISVLASSVDLSNVKISNFKYIGHKLPIQLFLQGDEYSSFNDALTYGGLTVVYVGGNKVGIMPDYYNFEMHDWSSSTLRNLATIGGRIFNMDPMGMGRGYSINFVGTATIGGQ
jgi:hypothetical protein